MKISEKSRSCPECPTTLTYSTKYECNRAEKKNKVCYSCRTKRLLNDPEYHRKLQEGVSKFQLEYKNGDNKRQCSPVTKSKIRKTLLDGKLWTKQSDKGGDIYAHWIKKYGLEIANEKMIEFKKKQSMSHIGKNNPMFGRPSPQGSGNGWSGWYNGWYFRSIHELSYMINVIEKNGWTWENAEQRKYSISYTDWTGNQRTYFADFIINGNMMVECKPKRLHQSKTVILKQKAAEDFCQKNGLTYHLECPILLFNDDIKMLCDTLQITFLPRYKEKYDLLVHRAARCR